MTRIITRYFDSAERARKVRHELVKMQGFSPRIVDLFDDRKGLVEALTQAHVEKDTAEAYEKKMGKTGAVLLVRAGYKPLSVARITRETMAEMGAADMGGLVEEVYVKDPPEPFAQSLLYDHPLLLSKERVRGSTTYHMANWPIPLISRRKPMTESVIEPHAHMANWPIPLISRRKPMDDFSRPRRGHNMGFIPLISRRKPADRFAFPRHARMANFPIPLLSDRKPYTGTMIGRHTRMANWPFPHLINGKTGTNALVPGHKFMARFPFDHIVPGHKYMAKFPFAHIVPGHRHMANFPLPLIGRRKPADPYAFPRHAHMADMILPLVTKSSGSPGSGQRWSFSRMLGLPTLKDR